VCASAIQTAAIALTTHPARITKGFAGGAGRDMRRPFDLRRRADRARLALYPPPRVRVFEPDPRRAGLAVCRVRLVVPPRGRAAPLGERVAMISTVTSPEPTGPERSRRVAEFREPC
jgi:hypothetical protein